MPHRADRDFDVVVVGSGAGGMLTAVRCHDLGMKVVVAEKSHFYGGTTALSGGQFWVPANHLMQTPDDRASAEAYLRAVTQGEIHEDKMQAYLDAAPEMARYLELIGVGMAADPGHPDYFPEVEGSRVGRAISPLAFDAARLGPAFSQLREASGLWKILHRYAIDTPELGLFAVRAKGWKRRFAGILARYWLDLPWRRKTRRDRRLTLGNALVGWIRKMMLDRDIPLLLNCEMARLIRSDDGAVIGAVFRRDGEEIILNARRGVVLAAGGFEHNQAMREKNLPVATSSRLSLAPGTNTGDALKAGLDVGAGTEFLDHAWWTPAMLLPDPAVPNSLVSHAVFRMPGCVLLNDRGERFVNESASYDRVGQAMIDDTQASGRSAPFWLLFDARYRRQYAAGGILPTALMPDRRIPESWWGSFLYRAGSLSQLALLIGLDPAQVEQVAKRVNDSARSGVDSDYHRGDHVYDRATAGNPAVTPNPCLAALEVAPFYAIRVELGDIGTKGGLRSDADARVLGQDGAAIAGLYATGNCAGALFAGAYPGPGSTLGPAMTFGFLAANHLAEVQAPRRNAAADLYAAIR